ncbi:MAG: hypothetical protein KJ767_04035 [Nanoarchaeota archaeon]|nr:hypothetical protein [Nanoarchaeota archaeon]
MTLPDYLKEVEQAYTSYDNRDFYKARELFTELQEKIPKYERFLRAEITECIINCKKFINGFEGDFYAALVNQQQLDKIQHQKTQNNRK